MARILLIDDDTAFSPDLAEALREHGHEVRWLEGAEEGLDLLSKPPRRPRAHFDVVLLDQCLPRMAGLEFLAALRRGGLDVHVVLFTAQGTSDVAIRASQLGAFRYLPKPDGLAPADLAPLLRLADEACVTANLPRSPAPDVPEENVLLGDSESMRAVYEQIGLAAGHDEPVLILGAPGTGKECVAQAIHRYSNRADRPLLRVNCLAGDSEWLEDELFGHEAGAYRCATAKRGQPGVFEQADGGAVLLDHFHLLNLPAQARIARLIREGVVQRGGRGASLRPVRARVLACSGEDMRSALDAGRLDRELYYLLELTTLVLPPLRQRGRDVLLLADHFLGHAAALLRRPARSLHPLAGERLLAHPWPGNIRELKGVIRRAVLACRGVEIGPEDLPLQPTIPPSESDQLISARPESPSLDRALPPSRERAYQLFLWAIDREPDLADRTDAEVFHWLRHDSRVEGDDLPASCDTFRRYLREARAHHDTHKHTPRAGRPIGPSMVRAGEL